MGDKSLKEYLEGLTKEELVKKMRIGRLIHSRRDKTTIIDSLHEYLQDEQNIEQIWNSLSPFEKDYMREFLKYNERPSYEIMKGMYQKHGMTGIYIKEPEEEQSKIGLFFIGDSVPPVIKRSLEKYLPPVIIKYDAVEQLQEDPIKASCMIAESFAQDFCNVIQLVKNVKLSLTKEKRIPSKSAVLKIDGVLANKDFVFEHIGGIDKVRSIDSTNRIYGVFMLMTEADLIYENGDIMSASIEADKFLELRLEDKCKYLFKHYLNSYRIFELSRIVESGYISEKRGDMTECRNVIIKHLRNCPVGKWVSARQFIDYIKMMDKNFLIDQVKCIVYFSDKHNVYLEPWVEWKEVEGRFVEVVLQEYLSAMGIVDTSIYEDSGGCSEYYEKPFYRLEHFRITPLGAFILGMSKEYHYEEKEDKSGFTVEDGFQIKVMNEFSNQAHKLFFERFAAKEEHPQFCTYKMSFGAIARALDKDISIESIDIYIRSHSYNGMLPEYGELMDKWKRDSDKVVIKNVMVVLTENKKLMDELQKELNLKKHMKNDLSNAFEIDPKAAKNVKRQVEKKGYYCRIS